MDIFDIKKKQNPIYSLITRVQWHMGYDLYHCISIDQNAY